MKEVSLTKSNVSYYLPQQSVAKESSTTTKLRLVYDGSEKPISEDSLNETLLCCPIIQKELYFVFLWFRSYKVALFADIREMYRQILVQQDDHQYQAILWRENQYEDVKHYQYQTVTYGTTSTLFLDIRKLHQLTADNQIKYPRSAEKI